MMFPFSKNTEDHFDQDKQEFLDLLERFSQQLSVSSDNHKHLAKDQISRCIMEIKASKNYLTLSLPIKWLEKELGAMIHDKQLQLSEDENQIWTQIKNLASAHPTGHGTGLGL